MLNGVMRRLMVIAMALVMLFSLMPTFAFAAETDAEWIADNVTTGYDETMFAAQPGTSDAKVTATQADDTAKFIIGTSGTTEYTLADALANLGSAKQITLSTSGTIYGTYTIPKGVTLCIPYDSSNTAIADMSKNYVDTTASTTSEYKRLTMANGAAITVNGSISVGSRILTSGANMGRPHGKYGRIDMNGGSSITLNSGANLYAWGYLTGDGTVNALSGSTVHEMFQIADFRGGKATVAMATGMYGCDSVTKSKVFPLNQYYIQNIEAHLLLSYGAEELVAAAITASNTTVTSEQPFISRADAMFVMKQGSTVEKYYDGSQDRLIFKTSGNVELSSLKVSVSSASLDTSDYELPINGNISIYVNSGTLETSKKVNLLPGAALYIGNEATLNMKQGGVVNVYDRSEWMERNYVGTGSKIKPVVYSPTKTKTRTEADLVDAAIYVNGSIIMNGGNVYTTQSGADVTGSNYSGTGDTGSVTFSTAAPASAPSTYQAVYSSASPGYTDYAITTYSAWLHNGPDASGTSFVQTQGAAKGSVYEWDPVSNTWLLNPVTVKYDNNDGSGLYSVQKVVKNQPTALGLSGKYTPPTQEGAELVWNTAPDGSGTTYTIGQSVTLSSDLTLYAYMKPLTYTVTWKNADGTVLKTDENVTYGDTPVYDGDIPTKANDGTNYFVFTGWDKTPAPVNGDVTYTAQFAPKALKFNIEVYYNVDGTQGEQAVYQKTYDYTQSVRLGAETTYQDGEDVYTFSHWDVDGVHYPALKITVRPGSADHTVVAQAVYVKNAADAEYQGDALLKVISVEAETIGHQTTRETNKLVFTLSQSVPEGEADAVGFVVSQTNQNPIIDGEGVMIAKSNLKTATSTFTTRVDVTGQIDQPIYVRAYLTYKNNGTSVTIYSDEPAVVYTFPTV